MPEDPDTFVVDAPFQQRGGFSRVIKAGEVLSGRYKLLRPLGQGSQAFVWVAEHLALGSQVAVKLIDPELAKQQDARDRFAREATAAAKLRSAHVVHILDHGIEGEQPFIVMELLEGEDLFDRLERRTRLTLSETSKIVTQVARALMRAHAEGIIHRDLKPENVFLVRNEDDELAKVLDFGVAKITTPAKAAMTRTGVGTLIGTPHYMSPEQVKGLTEIDHRSDLWSLGVIAYQCITGHLPFDSEGVGDLLIRITMSTPAKPSSVVPDVSPLFDEWFKKASAKDPDERFQTSREMADALAKVAGAPIAPVSQPGRVLVSLADSPDLDWGSLAGVRIPMPPKRSQQPSAARAPTLDGNDLVEVVDADTKASKTDDDELDWESPEPEKPQAAAPVKPAKPPPPKQATSSRERETEPPPSQRAPSSSRAPAPPPPKSVAPAEEPRASTAAAPAPASQRAPRPAEEPVVANPFLSVAGGAPPPSSRQPSSVRGLQTTVTGLASTSQPAPADSSLELEPSRRRRATWFVALAAVVVSVSVVVFVIRSRGGLSGLTNQNASPASPAVATGTATSTARTLGLGQAPPIVSGANVSGSNASATSSSSSDHAVDLNVTKKPTAKPTAAPGPRPKRPDEEEIEIIIPNEYREVPLPRR